MTNQPKCNSHPMCSHNTNGRDMKKPCSISVGITTQEKIQALTDKIDELLDGEIKELKRNCRIKMISKAYETKTALVNEVRKTALMCTSENGFGMMIVPKELNDDEWDAYQIIGRPILVGDVLRASPKRLWLDGEGYIYNSYRSCEDNELSFCRFELSKPLHEQSEQTIAELYKLFFE